MADNDPFAISRSDISFSDLMTTLKIGNENSAKIANYLGKNFASETAVDTSLAIAYSTTGGTLVSSAAGYLVSLSVTTVSTGSTGLCYDSASVLNAGSTNAFVVIPSSGFMTVNWPFQNGLVIQPSSQGSHKVSVAYI